MSSTLQHSFDLSEAFKRSHEINLDDYLDIRLYFDHISQLNQKDCENYLNEKRVLIDTKLQDICLVYSWTSTPLVFEMYERMDSESLDDFPCLQCYKRTGDNPQEEWFIVFLLYTLSMSLPNISISIKNHDGQFLLIEAAYHLPSCITPENDTNRVFLRSCYFCVLCQNPTQNISLKDALLTLENCSDISVLSTPSLQTCLKKRIQIYNSILDQWLQPFSLLKNKSTLLHSSSFCLPQCCLAIVPLQVAKLLQHYPHLLGIALDFLPPDCSTKTCKNDACYDFFYFKNETIPSVSLLLTLTRYQYACLTSFKFKKPLNFSYPKWKLPDSLEKKDCLDAVDMGTKICYGLHLACNSTTKDKNLAYAFFYNTSIEPNFKTITFYETSFTQSTDPSTVSSLCSERMSEKELLQEAHARKRLQLFDKHIASFLSSQQKQQKESFESQQTKTNFFFRDLLKFSCKLLDENVDSTCFKIASFHFMKQFISDTSWMDLHDQDMQEIIQQNTLEDRFHSFLHTPNTQTTQFNAPHTDKSSEAFESLLHASSDYRGVKPENHYKLPVLREPKDIPDEFKELYEQYRENRFFYDSDSNDICESDISSSDSSIQDAFKPSPKLFCVSSEEGIETNDLMDIMDEQLAEMTVEDKQNSCKRPFRLKSMTKDMIDTVFYNNIHQSKKEEHVLEPGPTTLLLSEFPSLQKYFK